MPIRDCKIYSFPNNDTTVLLPIKIINPHTNLSLKTVGLIDTGATECAIPAKVADILKHNLLKGQRKTINTGNGKSSAFGHTTSIDIFHPQNADKQIIYSLENVIIDFMPNLNVVLLGVRGFLDNFNLNINYPRRVFSLIK